MRLILLAIAACIIYVAIVVLAAKLAAFNNFDDEEL